VWRHLRYAADLARALFYVNRAVHRRVVIDGPPIELPVISEMAVVFLVVGAALFGRQW
jgi:hypothetical protein